MEAAGKSQSVWSRTREEKKNSHLIIVLLLRLDLLAYLPHTKVDAGQIIPALAIFIIYRYAAREGLPRSIPLLQTEVCAAQDEPRARQERVDRDRASQANDRFLEGPVRKVVSAERAHCTTGGIF